MSDVQLTGDATMRYYEFLNGFTKFEGIVSGVGGFKSLSEAVLSV